MYAYYTKEQTQHKSNPFAFNTNTASTTCIIVGIYIINYNRWSLISLVIGLLILTGRWRTAFTAKLTFKLVTAFATEHKNTTFVNIYL